MDIEWTTVFVDRTAPAFDVVRMFWQAVTTSTMSSTRGAHGEFSTFVPATGDAFVRLQRVDHGRGGSHLDLHVTDVRTSADEAIGLGADAIADLGGVVVLRSPGGLAFCVVEHHGESTRPPPAGEPGERTLVDQVCIDIAPDRFDAECAFWARLTGWELRDGREPEFRVLARPGGIPLRFLLQRRGADGVGADAGCHLDLACDDVDAAVRAHVELGAEHVSTFSWWTVMADPVGVAYCLTSRDPDTGLPAAP